MKTRKALRISFATSEPDVFLGQGTAAVSDADHRQSETGRAENPASTKHFGG